MEEIWKDIPGYEGLYQASNLGNIKRLEGLSKGRRNNLQKINGRILKPQRRGKSGYYAVDLSINGIVKSYRVNRIIAQTFLGLDINNKKIFVCHKNDTPQDNNANNLFLGTAKDNSNDMVNKGRQGGFKNKGESNGMSKFTREQKISMYKFIQEGVSYTEIKKHYNVSKPYLSNLKKGMYL